MGYACQVSDIFAYHRMSQNSNPGAEIAEQAIVTKVAALVRGDEKAQREYLENLVVRWDVTSRGLVSKYGFVQALIPLRLRIEERMIDALFNKYHNGQGYMDTALFFDNIYGGERKVKAPKISINHPAVQTALQDFRAAIARRGGLNGMRSLQRSFRIYDVNDDQMLTPAEMKAGLTNYGLQLPGPTVDLVLDAIDKNRDGKIDFTEFLRGIRGGMNKKRVALVNQAFDILDRDGSGVVEAKDLAAAYDAEQHPYVKQGRMTARQAMMDFMSQWDTQERDGKVTRDEFLEYYEDISTSVDRDDYFELMIRNAWHISGGEGWAANTTNKRVLVDDGKGNMTVQTIKNDLGVEDGDYDEYARRYQQQGGQGKIVRPPTTEAQRQRRAREQGEQQAAPRQYQSQNYAPPGQQQRQQQQYPPSRGQSRGQQQQYQQPRSRNGNRVQSPIRSEPRVQSRGRPVSQGERKGLTSSQTRPRGMTGNSDDNKFTHDVVKMFKDCVVQHGGSEGIITLGKIFRRMDDNHDFELSVPELKSGLADYGLNFTAHDCATLLTALDNNNSGSVSYNEFLRAVRGDMNQRRQNLVMMAYKVLDKTGDGMVNIDDIVSVYNVKQHPDVVAGRKTEREALRGFLDVWDSTEKDGIVTPEEFIEYYQGVSASIDLDDYFELMIRNAWKISGGKGAYENTTCLRVLVKFTDGTSKVVEIKDSIGLSSGNMSGIKSRLKKQGVNNIAKVSTTY